MVGSCGAVEFATNSQQLAQLVGFEETTSRSVSFQPPSGSSCGVAREQPVFDGGVEDGRQ